MADASPDRILFLLKTRGALSAAALATELGMTSMGARQHLAALHEAGLVAFTLVSAGRGRPGRLWSLTLGGDARFPDRHADVSVMLIEQVRSQLGEAALDGIISAHEEHQRRLYEWALEGARNGGDVMLRLAQLRTNEGYMAEASALENGEWRLVENHCPICAAAAACQGFCRAELSVFRRLLAPYGQIDREEHLLDGARRCAYRFRPAKKALGGAAA